MTASSPEGALAEAVMQFGSETKLAQAAGVSQNAIWSARRNRRVSAELAVAIERATEGKVRRSQLRPDLWDEPARSAPAPDMRAAS